MLHTNGLLMIEKDTYRNVMAAAQVSADRDREPWYVYVYRNKVANMPTLYRAISIVPVAHPFVTVEPQVEGAIA